MNTRQDKPPVRKRSRPLLLRDEERYQLLFGPYEPPLVKRGFLVDAVRGKVPFGTFTNALIPWPKARRVGKSGSGGMVLCGDLLRALEQESGPAISHHWGVSRATVGNWRRALEMKGRTAGAQRLVNLGVELARLPESREKIAEAARGRVLSPRHKARFHGGVRKGWRERFKARRAAYRQTGRFPKATKSDPWLPEEERLLSQFPTKELAQVLGRTIRSIHAHRNLLGICAVASERQKPWEEWEVRLLGTDLDRAIAGRLGRSATSVERKRRDLRIPSAGYHLWTADEEALFGKLSDAEIARRLGRTPKAVQHHRLKLGMALFRRENQREWTAREIALLGTDTDARIAKRLGRTARCVAQRRREEGIPIDAERHHWTPQELAVLGTMSDVEAARKLNLSLSSVANKRMKSGISAGFNRRWTRSEEALLGTMPDEEVAAKLGRGAGAVFTHRKKLQIPVYAGSAQ